MFFQPHRRTLTLVLHHGHAHLRIKEGIIFIERMTSDRNLKASREGSKKDHIEPPRHAQGSRTVVSCSYRDSALQHQRVCDFVDV